MSHFSHLPEPPELDPRLGAFLTTTLGRGLRAPLHSLLGFLQLLAMSDLDRDQTRLVDQVVASSEELLAADDRLSWLLRLLSGTHIGRPRTVRLADVVAEASAVVDVAASVHARPGTPSAVTADVPALVQLLAELLANARTHGAAPVAVELEPGPGGDGVRVAVTDAGTGLGAEARAQLLGPLRAPERDAGVGLLLVRRLGAALGASFEVPSTSAGTRVCVDLPLHSADAADAAAPVRDAEPAPPAVPSAPTRPLRVLLVEDNATNRLLTQRQLDRLGHTMTACATGGAGVEAALAGGVDVVLMDLHLPDLDGVEATRRIRAAEDPSAPRLPIVAVTADATAEAREACRAAGMDQVLTKPVDLTDLAAALARACAAPTASSAPAARAAVPEVLRRVAARVEGDPVAAALFVSTYLAELPARRLLVQAALRRGDARTALAAAESLRTASDTMGATALAAACAALGAAVRTQSIETARAFLPALLLHSQQLHEELLPFTDEREVAAVLGAGPRAASGAVLASAGLPR